ncbi:MAG: hypothetical protein B9S32_13485 [Verrucomicrobia bacterium Tous-C9LFEB]|nr:MAG: hypothetical protein B9S32_13485 [Verrucomicrobia bacterium Tous-C9LFEB]
METPNRTTPPVSPHLLGIFQSYFPDHPIVLSALEEARTQRINYGTLANLAALADQSHAPDLTQAVLELFATLSHSATIRPRQPQRFAVASQQVYA